MERQASHLLYLQPHASLLAISSCCLLPVLCAQLLFVCRLEQEVWSNSLVVASFYGPVHSTSWWLAAIVSTAIPAFYCFTGGMRASLFTDVFQV
jgi:Na+/proline symporter